MTENVKVGFSENLFDFCEMKDCMYVQEKKKIEAEEDYAQKEMGMMMCLLVK